jgi:hypothetical protein
MDRVCRPEMLALTESFGGGDPLESTRVTIAEAKKHAHPTRPRLWEIGATNGASRGTCHHPPGLREANPGGGRDR